MRTIKKGLLVLVVFVLLIPFLPVSEASAQATNYTLNSVSGIWTDTDGGGYTVTGVGTNEVRWGRGLQQYDWEKSGLRFNGTSNQSFGEGDVFLIGTLTHLNWPVQTPAASGATLEITLNFGNPSITPAPEFTFDFEIEETTNEDHWWQCNSGFQQTYTPCDDRITFPNYGEESFRIGDTLYTLKIVGFVDTYPGGAVMESFVTEEARNSSAYLVGMLSSVLVEAPDITITKKTNNIDVTSAPGPELVAGDSVTWQYIVQNTGNVDLTNVTVVDNEIGPITCPQNTLASGASMTCTASGTVEEGQYSNTATVNGTYSGGSVSDDDTSWYHGITASIDVEKEILNGSTWLDADAAPGPNLLNGTTPKFRFTVKNTGDVALTDLSLSDSDMTALFSDEALQNTCVAPASLASDSSFVCYGSLPWQPGQHENQATATGKYAGVTYDDMDLAHYFGITASIDVEKEILNGSTWVDADTATGPELVSGTTPKFRFTVKNTGDVALSDLTLSDSDISLLFSDEALQNECVAPASLASGSSFICYGGLTWQSGQHENQATATGKYAGVTYDDTDLAHYFGITASIDVEKEILSGSIWMDADVIPGPELTEGTTPKFRFTVKNTGDVALTDLTLSDSDIGSLFSDEALQNACVAPASLASDSSFVCYGSLTWQSGQHENEATATGKYAGVTYSDDDQAHYFGPQVGISLDKIAVPTVYTALDDVITYQFTARNTGNVTLTNVMITDPLSGLSALDCSPTQPAILSPGGTLTCTATYTVGQSDLDVGSIENTATVTGKDPHDVTVSDEDDAVVEGPKTGGSIDLVKTASPETFAAVGDEITYTFTATNDGIFTLTDVTITDPLSGLSALVCNIAQPAELDPGEKLICTATYTIDQDDLDNGAVENTATASGKDPFDEPVEDEDDADVEGPATGASIDLVKSPDPEVFTKVDDVITYTFTVTNNGIFTLTDVTVVDPLPGLSALECEPDQNATLLPGEQMVCTATYAVTQADLNKGMIDNIATATGMGPGEETVDDDGVAVIEGPKDEASIHLAKSADSATYDQVGDEITYTFVVTNDGLYTLTDVVITDALFGLTFGPIDTFEPGASETFKYTYTVTQADIDASKILNVATATGKDPSENPVTSTDDATVYGPEQPKVTPDPKELPVTGFAPNRITVLPAQPAAKAYAEYSNFWLEVPKLGIKVDIVGVPTSDEGWDVTWLGQQAGWLYGTTFPTWPGNATITGHVWDAFDQAGPFVDLTQLAYGDQIIIHLNDSEYVFEVRSKHLVLPDDTNIIEQPEDYSWVNLITCQGFNEDSEAYLYRLIVRAILVDVK